MDGTANGLVTNHDRLGRFTRGNTVVVTARERKRSILERLRREYDPDNALSGVDTDRLALAAKHYAIAETTRDATLSVRSIGCAERLLAKIRKPAVKTPTLAELGLA
jgi:hypothetical protein